MGRAPDVQSRPRWLSPSSIALLYAAAGWLWILGSDWLTLQLIADPGTRAQVQTLKGWVYVGATALLLHLLIRRSTRALQQSEEYVREILRSMAEGVLVGTPDGMITDLNPAARTILGLEGVALPIPAKRVCGEALVHDNGSEWKTPLERALSGQVVRTEQAQWRRPGGEVAEIEVSAAPLYSRGEDTVTGGVVLIRDVSEHRRLARARDAFLSDAAHELKTPVATIKAWVQVLQRWTPQGHEPREGQAFEVLSRQCDRVARIVEQLLQISLAGRAAEKAGAPPPVELRASLEELASRFRLLAPRRRIVFHCEEPLVVHAGRDELEMVVSNLLENAIKFSPEGSTIEVTASRAPGGIEVSVRDEGIGIPPDRQEHLGERYYKAHAGTAQDAGGLGVGLYLCRELLRRHGGHLTIESAPGEGTTARIHLPPSEEARS